MQSYDTKFVEERPWGMFERFTHNEVSTVKLIYIKPNETLSLQYHNNRAEFWKVIKGPAKITIGDKTVRAEEGEEFFIPVKAVHRMGSFDAPVTILEIAFGHQDEKDIVRLEDKYKRA
ncbi:phosphomannose isomerase type II C-terminal cupin domain [Candidatus Woesearchaeota archaeon]|nr:phosphomannose isomerase type II C-terminal cupin domain [Candidatus Woesearchaeota archaeon]